MTLREFRATLKKQFDTIDNGGKVLITRGGSVYELIKVAT